MMDSLFPTDDPATLTTPISQAAYERIISRPEGPQRYLERLVAEETARASEDLDASELIPPKDCGPASRTSGFQRFMAARKAGPERDEVPAWKVLEALRQTDHPPCSRVVGPEVSSSM